LHSALFTLHLVHPIASSRLHRHALINFVANFVGNFVDALKFMRKAVLMSGEQLVARAEEFKTTDKLAFERTRLAYERTMMAWIRTSTALIAFGFGMYKLFELVPFNKQGEHAISPRAFALVLAFLGNLCLLLAAIQHRKSLQAMRALGFKIPVSVAAIIAGFLSLLGIFVLIVVLLKL
jgi:putative membrane protein